MSAAALFKRSRLLLPCLLLLLWAAPAAAAEPETDPETGLIIAPGFEQVRQNCTVCHSAKLITQNRADRDGWLEMIRWMQAKQGLWELEPEVEKSILDYLSTHYAPSAASRRPPLDVQFPE